eukprot:7943662-Pyramimonas_sp.AAC.1
MLSLQRVGWELVGPHHIKTDQSDALSLLRTSPSDVRHLLREGISRALGIQLVSSLPEAQGHEVVWVRALRP